MRNDKNGILLTALTALLVFVIFASIRMAGARPVSVRDEVTVGFIYVGDDRQIVHRFCRGQEVPEPKVD